MRLLEAMWLILPVLSAGLGHIAVIRLDLLPLAGRWPLDGNRTWRGRRLLGDNKTVRGVIVMTLGSALAAALIGTAFASTNARLAVAPLQSAHPGAWGLLLGLGYCLGELPNSFVKRQLGIAPGDIAAGARGALSWVTDQLDSVVGVVLALGLAWHPDPAVVAWLVALALLIHPLVAALMVGLGLKDRIG